jgi:hypothetical protein
MAAAKGNAKNANTVEADKTYAQNARFIEEQMSEAAQNLSEALENVRKAMEAVAAGEREVPFKMPEFENLKGFLHIGFGTANRMAADWDGYATARENH